MLGARKYLQIFPEYVALFSYYLQYYKDKLKNGFDINKLDLNIEKTNIIPYINSSIKRYKNKKYENLNSFNCKCLGIPQMAQKIHQLNVNYQKLYIK